MRLFIGIFLSTLVSLAFSANSDPLIISSEALSQRLGRPDVLILDARPETEYAQGHILGAVNVPTQSTYSKTPPTYLMATPAKLETLFRQAGLNNDQQVVVYGNDVYRNAPRLLWVLQALGKSQVRLLDGGWPLWKAEKRPFGTEPVTRPAGDFTARIHPEHTAGLLQTRLAIQNPGVQLIDSRRKDEFDGHKTRARHAGHIPTAINAPPSLNLRKQDGIQRIVSLSQLRKRFTVMGHKPRYITYCNAGHEGAMTYLNLRRLGIPVALYDGSWLEWGNRDDLPIAEPQLDEQVHQ